MHEQIAALALGGLRDHDFDAVERYFDGPMKQEVPREKVARIWSRTIATSGELLSWTLVARDSPDGFDQLRYELNLEHGKLEALVTFPREGRQIAGLLLRPIGSD